jgi:lipoate-protein ligase A
MFHARLLRDEPASGAWNMAVDEAILTSAADGGAPTLRFYWWEVPTLSLGYFQEYDDREGHAASRQCPCVRRASGGGAIMHDREITYSFAAPPGSVWAKNHLSIYDIFHSTLVDTLAERNIVASLCRIEGSLREQASPFLCFERRANGDVLVGEIKIAGSAQRRFGGAVVQHGSILFDRSACAPELPGLNDLGHGVLTQESFLDSWLPKLTEKMSLQLTPGSLTQAERGLASRLTEEKFGSDGWNRYRNRAK